MTEVDHISHMEGSMADIAAHSHADSDSYLNYLLSDIDFSEELSSDDSISGIPRMKSCFGLKNENPSLDLDFFDPDLAVVNENDILSNIVVSSELFELVDLQLLPTDQDRKNDSIHFSDYSNSLDNSLFLKCPDNSPVNASFIQIPDSEATTPVSSPSPSPYGSPRIDIDSISIQDVEAMTSLADFVEPSKFFPALFDAALSSSDEEEQGGDFGECDSEEEEEEEEEDEEDFNERDSIGSVVVRDGNMTVKEEHASYSIGSRGIHGATKVKKEIVLPNNVVMPSKEDIRAIISAVALPAGMGEEDEEEDIDVVTISEPLASLSRPSSAVSSTNTCHTTDKLPSSYKVNSTSLSSPILSKSMNSSYSQKRKPSQQSDHFIHKSKKTRVGLDYMKSVKSGCNSVETSDSERSCGSDSKRNIHNVLERKRRNDLKYSFQTLRSCVPDIEKNDKAPKVLILKKATDYIALLKRQEEELLAEKEKLKASNKMVAERVKALKATS